MDRLSDVVFNGAANFGAEMSLATSPLFVASVRFQSAQKALPL
ncbi:hypothetical protein [Vibrio mytili]|nr:hypothetical protein [Vibrio mytili]